MPRLLAELSGDEVFEIIDRCLDRMKKRSLAEMDEDEFDAFNSLFIKRLFVVLPDLDYGGALIVNYKICGAWSKQRAKGADTLTKRLKAIRATSELKQIFSASALHQICDAARGRSSDKG